jgi:hypothetical protein
VRVLLIGILTFAAMAGASGGCTGPRTPEGAGGIGGGVTGGSRALQERETRAGDGGDELVPYAAPMVFPQNWGEIVRRRP